MTESFGRDVNRFHKVPAINDNGFKLSESAAIFHYMGRKDMIPERWYPSRDFKTLVRIDEYLEWQQNNLFATSGMMFRKLWIEPMVTGKEAQKDDIEFHKKTVNRTLDDLENIWLKDNKFITGEDITFADLMAISMLEQVVGLNIYSVNTQRHPKVAKWADEVRHYFGDAFQQAHKFLYKFAMK